MPNIDPLARFWIGIIITIAIGVSQGTLVLTNAVPAGWIPYVTTWCGIIAFIGSSVLTALNGAATTTSSRISSAAIVKGVEGFKVDQKIADIAKQAAGDNAKVTTS